MPETVSAPAVRRRRARELPLDLVSDWGSSVKVSCIHVVGFAWWEVMRSKLRLDFPQIFGARCTVLEGFISAFLRISSWRCPAFVADENTAPG